MKLIPIGIMCILGAVVMAYISREMDPAICHGSMPQDRRLQELNLIQGSLEAKVGKWTIPTKVRITKQVTYEILFAQSLDEKTTVGECRFTEKQIVLKLGEPHEEMLSTLIHEILHAMSYEYGVDLPHKAIYQMEGPLLELMKLNL